MNERRQGELENPIKIIDDKSTALFAHNVIRKLHGLNLLEWDNALAAKSCQWAVNLAKTNSGLLHSSPLITYGENIYISKGMLDSTRTSHAVLLWYRGIEHYDFNSPGFNLSSGSFSQLVWKETKKVGVGIVYREDTQTTFIVAQYSPPGNTRYKDSYSINVVEPKLGLPAKIPAIEDFTYHPSRQSNTRTEVSLYGRAREVFRSICKWCSFSGPKPVESWSSSQTDPETRHANEESERQVVKRVINLVVDPSKVSGVYDTSNINCYKAEYLGGTNVSNKTELLTNPC